MEKTDNSYAYPTPEQFIELMKGFVLLRYKLFIPEHTNQFKQQAIENLLKNKLSNADDYHIITRIFMFLANREKPPTMGEISTELNTPLSTATRIIDWLVQTKIVERVSDPDDRRVVRIGIAEKGWELNHLIMDYYKKKIEELMTHFSAEEQTQLIHLSSKLLDLLIPETGNRLDDCPVMARKIQENLKFESDQPGRKI